MGRAPPPLHLHRSPHGALPRRQRRPLHQQRRCPPPPSAEEEAATAAADAAHAAAVAAGARGAPARLVVRLTRGGRLQRTWGAADAMGDVRSWVARALAREEPGVGGAWQLACVHPRKVFDDDQVTVGEAGLTPSASLVVRRL